ncbi:Hypothetical predicted protein [Mytilus galloprovincialis]|uniref:Endonuclease/exonuclease/phosphatase domain-containing protein n=1 Tax=Mytilus galloprovincialis TaxID=29158 RepID=A0A8B6GK72_MYTGA|nr:Hypothetical predicted protein [Mytilus galloprovincialis]
MSDTSSGPGFLVAEKTPSVSSIKHSKSSVSDGSSSGSRFEVLADMHTDGYICKPVPLLKSKYKQGGGLYLLIKNCFAKYVEVVDIQNDTIIWLKVSKDISTCGFDYFIECVYLPPAYLNYYKMYNCDLFYDLLNSVEKYSSETSRVFLLGDMNARTAIVNDFIINDNVCGPIFDSFNHILGYLSDTNLPVRRNPDQSTNEFGLKLLNLCRSTGLRILNGRHKDGLANDYTFCGSRGMSVVDYLLAPYDFLHIIDQFIVCNFTSFSDHAPLHVRLRCILHDSQEPERNSVDTPETVSDTTYDELDQIITQDEILKCISNLKRGKSHGIDGTFNELFIEFKDILLPFLEEIFNKILASGHFPKSWALAVLIPVFKKGDSSDSANYRGISVVSNLAKLFTSI